MPTESSVADQMDRLVPSHVGSRVFIKADSSTVFMTEKDVTLVYRASLFGPAHELTGRRLTPADSATINPDWSD
ncbi:hypothetical protein PtrM4_109950 [Pyrenophora tritici-repentis]|uniref:Uncharacterized protein n=1 Tax=Pyrenophora tritici-repentis TaxID=45151 RepID=A0A834RW26_9PLEO|nr:hypothetical protein PtrM4_109950 [Pyrenophora tritici-repentis]